MPPGSDPGAGPRPEPVHRPLPAPPPGRPATSGGPPSPDRAEEVFRLHPITPFALGGRVLGAVAVLTLLSLAEHRGSGSTNWTVYAVYAAVAAVVVVRGAVTVAVTRYHLLGGELRIDSGLFVRQSKRIRLDRVQSVDVLEPFSARIFGLAEVRITTAGSERAAVRLRYLAEPVARALRADMLGRSVGVGEGADEAPERLLVAVPHQRLVGSVLLQMVSWRIVFLALGPALTVLGQQNGHQATTGIGIFLIVTFLIAIVQTIWRRISSLWDFTVSDSPDGLRVRHGLLSTSRQTVPPGRIQAVLIHQPLTWRPFGWVQVRMNVAGYGSGDASKRTMLVPVVDRRYAEQLVGWLFGGVDVAGLPGTRPPRRAAWRSPLWWRGQWVAADDRVLVARHGLLSKTVDVVPHQRTQSLRLTAGPLERALGLVSFHLDSTRGPVRTRVSNRPAAEGRRLLEREIERSRTARRLETGRPAPTAAT